MSRRLYLITKESTMSANSSETSAPQAVIREAVGVFDDSESFQAAADELMSAGFDRAELSLLASDKIVQAKLGHSYEKVSELEDDAAVPRAAFVGRDSLVEARVGVIGGLAYIGALAAIGAVVASGGTLAGAIAAAAVAGGGGGLIGSVAARYIGRDRATEMQTQIDKGGLLLWVHIRDDEHEKRPIEILGRYGADDVHVHDIQVTAEPESNPLTGIDPDPFLGAKI